MEEILFWNNGLFRQPYWYSFLYSKLMQNKYCYDAVRQHPRLHQRHQPARTDEAQQGEVGRDKYAHLPV